MREVWTGWITPEVLLAVALFPVLWCAFWAGMIVELRRHRRDGWEERFVALGRMEERWRMVLALMQAYMHGGPDCVLGYLHWIPRPEVKEMDAKPYPFEEFIEEWDADLRPAKMKISDRIFEPD